MRARNDIINIGTFITTLPSLAVNGGTVTSSGANNIVQTDDGFGGSFANVNAMLGALADNGGTTQTHALLAGSPAIDMGNSGLAVDADNNPLEIQSDP